MTTFQKQEDLQFLFDQWVKGPLDKELVSKMVDYADDDQLTGLWMKLIEELEGVREEAVSGNDEVIIRRVYESLVQSAPDLRVKRRPVLVAYFRRYAAAAILIAILGIAALYTRYFRGAPAEAIKVASVKHDLSPGKNGAILTLSDGRLLSLDSMSNGLIATQKGAAVSLKSGQIVYHPEKPSDREVTFNKMSTPRGRKFQLTLSDGTRVWLNAASSITYPTNFTERQRVVSVEGEAYFEVAPDKSRPFIVRYPISQRSTTEGQVEVLGTSFNINAYPDEGVVKATLVNGSVRVRREQMTLLLLPGQQAQLSGTGKIRLLREADVAMETAWINGEFNFKYADLQTIMRQLARWYDLDVAYEPGAPLTRHFGGEIPMNTMLSQVLTVLGNSGVRFKLEERRLTILP